MDFYDGVAFKWNKEYKNKVYISFRLSKDLLKKIDEFAKKLELVYIEPLKGKGYRSIAIRLALEDTMLRFFGPKDNKDDITCPYYNEMSKIIPILKNIRLRKKLEDLPEGDNQEEIDKIVKEFA